MALINDFVLERNWIFIGRCGCTQDKNKYVNTDRKGWEIRIAIDGSEAFEIRHEDITRRGGTGLQSLKDRYNELFK